MKKNIIIGVILFFVIILAAVYYFFLSDSTAPIGGEEDQSLVLMDKPQPRPREDQKLLAISASQVVSPVLTFSQDAVWYFKPVGQLYRNSLLGDEEVSFGLTDIYPISRAFWPPAGNDFILDPEEGDLRRYEVYLADAKTFVSLSTNIQNFAWLPGGDKIVYVWQRGDGGFELKISNADGTNYSKVADLEKNYQIFPFPHKNFAMLLEEYEGQPNEALLIDLAIGTNSKILDRGENFGIKISPDGDQMLFARLNEQRLPELWLYNFNLDSYKNLEILSVPEKIVWAPNSTGFFYGQPSSLVDTDPQLFRRSDDALNFYNLSNGMSIEVYPRQIEKIDYREMMVVNDRTKLLFINRWDGKLYRLNLE